MGETKVIYHIDEEDTPYLVKLQMSPKEVTLADLKQVLNKPNYKYFFKSQDDDFGVVKEEIALDSSGLPLFNGRVVCWLELAQGSTVGSNGGGQEGGGGGGGGHHSETDSSISGLPPPGIERGPGVGETRPPSFHGGILAPEDLTESESILSTRQETDDLFDDTESSITSVSQAAADRRRHDIGRRMRTSGPSSRRPRLPGPGIPRPGQRPPPMPDTASSMMSSELESSIYEDTEDAQSMASSRFTTSTDHTSVSQQMLRNRQKRRSKRRVPAHLARAGSISSVTDSTMSLNCITVTLNMDTVNFLGISIVGQSNKFGDGDCGIYVGSIMKGGAVALDGRIEPGDMILQVNEISFENMSNDDAVRVLREVVQKPGPIKLVVAKCWDPAPSKNYFTIPRTEPVRPIDPGAWVAHTAAVRGNLLPGQINHGVGPPVSHFAPRHNLGDYPGRCPSVTTLSASSMVSSHADTEKFIPLGANATSEIVDLEPPESLTNNSGMGAIVRAMQRPDSNLEVRDRMWLKIKISNAFIGSDVVDWLYERVQGFSDRREARKYASQMLKAGFIKHTVNKTSFSEQCYYTFGEDAHLNTGMSNLSVKDSRSGSGSGIGAPPAYSLPPPQGPAPPIPTVGNPPGPQTNWGVPLWSDWQGDEVSSTNYGPIYNPSAPPPTASYMPLPYGVPSGGSSGPPGAFGYNAQQPSVISSGGSGSGSQKLRLAGSCSSSESDGRTSTVVSSDGGFRVALAKQEQQQQQQQQLQSGLSGQGVVPRDGPTAPVGRIDYPSGPQPPSYLAAISIQR
ncbi:segment polarity protein dishevelled homolog DVL-3-like isoform X1 [Tigriopus californicus]|uniref:segment polarity protein dishevelled homolog DVL-3-like isoform X1 n=1 Tax=Tigriopus californicus TaxID=6832 RepID=UPI0027DA84B1|nr:segment polarity protein dishevelled homolog DVL-3-like isoform X1 [Tigriopus californicus]